MSTKLLSAIILLLAVACFTVSCGAPGELAKVVEVSPDGWFTPIEIPYEVDDTVNMAKMQLVLRYGNRFKHDSINLVVSTTAPDGVVWNEPLTLYTTPTDKLHEVVECDYRRNIRWSQSGEYRVTLHPQHIYKGISAAGVKVIYNE